MQEIQILEPFVYYSSSTSEHNNSLIVLNFLAGLARALQLHCQLAERRRHLAVAARRGIQRVDASAARQARTHQEDRLHAAQCQSVVRTSALVPPWPY